jgi:hypothetical protein
MSAVQLASIQVTAAAVRREARARLTAVMSELESIPRLIDKA